MKEKDFLPHHEYDRRNSSTPSVISSSSSSSSSSTTTTAKSTTTTTAASTIANSTTASDSPSWFERKLFSHFKRLFRRNSFPSKSNLFPYHHLSSTTEPIITSTSDEQSKQINKEEAEDKQKEKEKEDENKDHKNLSSLSSSSSPTITLSSSISITVCEQTQSITNSSNSIDLLYDYDRLLARCLERQQHDRTEMISRCQIPITIPHADLVVGHSRSIVVNWKSYVRLFRALNRDASLFQQYVNQYYACKSSVNQHEQLTFNVRTTKTTFDNVLKLFLNEYVTCLACQKAETHLIKSAGLWRIECQLCGSQRSVKRLKWNLS